MNICNHQVQYNGLCAVCGTLLESLSDEEYINMSYDNIGLTVSKSEAERLEVENAKRLLKEQKLSLILDLDQTIVHASCDARISQWKNSEIRQFTLPNSPAIYYIKLRPGLEQFLKAIESLYDLHIYTMGTKDYAKAVANEIDPEGLFFKERILSRDESGCLTQKKLQRIFPCDTSMVVVLDDRSDVWNYSPNLVRIKPYEYFIGTGDIHSPDKKKPEVESSPTCEKEKDGPDEYTDKDTELYTMLNILKQTHQIFYENKDQGDVTKIIPKMKQEVLSNCIISFAPNIIPENIRDPTLSWIWQMATSFGGTCSTDLTGKTTHLIAIKWDTKAKAAKEYGHSKIVTPAWLLDSTARWSIQNEEMYGLQDESDIDSVSLEDSLLEKEKEISVDWDEVNKEVDDFMNESGIDDDGDTTDSDSTIQTLNNKVESPTASLHKKWKRKRAFGKWDESGAEDEDTGISKDRLKKRGKSQLSKVTIMPSRDTSEDNAGSSSGSSSSSSSSSSNSSSSSESENNNSNNYNTSVINSDDEDDLDSFAGILEEELQHL